MMRGGSRVGCQTSDVYDSLLGIFIDCDEGRLVVGKPTGESRVKREGEPALAGSSALGRATFLRGPGARPTQSLPRLDAARSV